MIDKIEFTAAETTAILRWVPQLDADRKELFGSRPTARMVCHFDIDDTRIVALCQVTLIVNQFRMLLAQGSPTPPDVIANDLRLLGHVAFRLTGKTSEEIAAIDREAQNLAAHLTEGTEGRKH